MGTRTRKGTILAVAVAGAVLATGSAAFACVKFKGDMQLTVPGAPSMALGVGSGSRVTGDGSDLFDTYCSNLSSSRPGVGLSGEPLWAPDVSRTGAVRVEVWPATACNPGGLNRLPSGVVDVWMFNGASFNGADGLGWHFVAATECLVHPATSHRLGSFNVLSGAGAGTFSLVGVLTSLGRPLQPNVLPTEASSICVGTTFAGDGIAAPVQVLI